MSILSSHTSKIHAPSPVSWKLALVQTFIGLQIVHIFMNHSQPHEGDGLDNRRTQSQVKVSSLKQTHFLNGYQCASVLNLHSKMKKALYLDTLDQVTVDVPLSLNIT